VRTILTWAALVVAVAPAAAQSPPAGAAATLAYVRGLRADDGGFRPSAGKPSDLRATLAAVRATKYFGGSLSAEEAKAAGQFLADCADPSTGGFAGRPGGKPDVVTTAAGLMALADLGLATGSNLTGPALNYLVANAKTYEDIRMSAAAVEATKQKLPKAASWLKEAEKLRNPDGTYGPTDERAFMTGGTAVTILRLGGQVADRAAVLKALRTGQNKDGGFSRKEGGPSELGSTYRIARAFHMLGAKPVEPEKLTAFIGRCRNADGGYGAAPGEPSTVATTYFAGVVQNWMK
jgi:prenyltransferase beta subunit